METKQATGNNSLKNLLFVAILFMSVSTQLELYLLDHYEDAFQLIPIICLSLAILTFVLIQLRLLKGLIQAFRVSLILSVLSGIYGTFLHLRANYEFEAEINAKSDSWSLFVESLSGALPALAPLSMILFAIIGYSYLTLIKQKL